MSASQRLAELTTVHATKKEARGNLNIRFDPELGSQCSEQWQMGDIGIQFIQLEAGCELTFESNQQTLLAKVITGSLSHPERTAFCEPYGLQDTRLLSSTFRSTIRSGANGALLAIFSIFDPAAKISKMAQLQFSGPSAEALQWRLFSEQYGAITDAFAGADAYIGPGFHLLDKIGDEITYLNLWTAGKGVDLTTHNHGHTPSEHNPAFSETHLVLSNGTGVGGMYTCNEPGDSARTRFPVATGFEHGPFFDFDAMTGAPVLRDNGAVQYPWHGWEAGTDSDPGQRYDVVAAFETTVQYTYI